MYVIQNFTSQTKPINYFDQLIWLIGLKHYKSLGYKIKLYCEEKDIQFLKDCYIYYYYDEIDTEAFAKNYSWLDGVNQEHFWFFRKIIAIEHEIELGTDFFYSDTDIVINKKPDFSDCDIYTWCLENYDDKVGKSIYVDLKELSLPPEYTIPGYLAKTTDKNYNCGLLYFKNKDIFYYWKKEMLRFATNNPCIIFNKNYIYTSHIFACTCEQRILTGIIKDKNLIVKTFDTNEISNGLSDNGGHFFGFRYGMKNKIKDFNLENYLKNWQTFLIYKYFIQFFMNELLETNSINEYLYFANKKDIHDLLELDDLYNRLLLW